MAHDVAADPLQKIGGCLKFGRERVFVLKASQILRQGLIRSRSYWQGRRRVAVRSGTVKGEFRTPIADWLQQVLRCGCHLRASLVARVVTKPDSILTKTEEAMPPSQQ